MYSNNNVKPKCQCIDIQLRQKLNYYKISVNGSVHLKFRLYSILKSTLSRTRTAPRPLMGAASLEPNYSLNFGWKPSPFDSPS